MLVLQKEQLPLLEQRIDEMLDILKKYDVHINFKEILHRIKKNIKICIFSDFEDIEELSRYVYEDWRDACKGKEGIENWYLRMQDVDKKADINREFDKCAIEVDKILNTNFLIPRKWYSYNELVNLGKKCKEEDKEWGRMIEKFRAEKKFFQSPMKDVSDDIWSFAKMLCLVEDDKQLIGWFQEDVPEFGYLAPIQILQLEYGEFVLRLFLRSVQC